MDLPSKAGNLSAEAVTVSGARPAPDKLTVTGEPGHSPTSSVGVIFIRVKIMIAHLFFAPRASRHGLRFAKMATNGVMQFLNFKILIEETVFLDISTGEWSQSNGQG